MSYCHSRAEESRAKETEGGRVGANFGCMACGVRITIFSAALLHHTVCSITIYCRERGGGGQEEKSKGSGGRGGGVGGGVLSDAGDEEVDVKRAEENRVSRKDRGWEGKNILYTEAVSTEDMG